MLFWIPQVKNPQVINGKLWRKMLKEWGEGSMEDTDFWEVLWNAFRVQEDDMQDINPDEYKKWKEARRERRQRGHD